MVFWPCLMVELRLTAALELVEVTLFLGSILDECPDDDFLDSECLREVLVLVRGFMNYDNKATMTESTVQLARSRSLGMQDSLQEEKNPGKEARTRTLSGYWDHENQESKEHGLRPLDTTRRTPGTS